jgi:hypothetical protein
LQAITWYLSRRERADYTTRQELTGAASAPLELSGSEVLALFRQAAAALPDDDDA